MSIIYLLLKYNTDDEKTERISFSVFLSLMYHLKDLSHFTLLDTRNRKKSLLIAAISRRSTGDIFRSGPVGKHFSCIINVATRNLFTNADVSTRKGGRFRYESDSRKLAWIGDFMTNARTTNSIWTFYTKLWWLVCFWQI